MNNIEGFLSDPGSQSGVFCEPVCSDLEPRYQRIFSESVRNAFGVYVSDDIHVVAEVKEVEIVGYGSWVKNGRYESRGNVIVKNPRQLPLFNAIGITNAIAYDEDSGLVFAGRIVGDRVTVLRPVISEFQDIFREELVKTKDVLIQIAS